MYETYFNLAERPFASVPRSDHYYPAAVIQTARATLARCVERGEGVAMVIGPSGTGKSLLCQLLAEQFEKTFQVVLLASGHLDTRRSLLQATLYELGRPYRGMDEGELRLSLVDYITLNEHCKRGVLMIVDEAQHLSLRLLDEIRALTNLMRNMQPAIRLVLAGSHLLEERFASPKLESFSQRISARCYLEALSRSETEAYIQGRIAACGSREEIFPAEACQMVHKATDGVPRLINQVCDHVLLLAYAAGIRRIEPAHVEEAWADLQQLPTPWNAPAVPQGESVIEFGGLDDSPLEAASIAGRITAADASSPGDAVLAEAAAVADLEAAPAEDDPQSFEQLRHIQKLLADVQAEFQPASASAPEVELIIDAPHPFAEPFQEEEVVADRYAPPAATPKAPPAASPAVVESPSVAERLPAAADSIPAAAAVPAEIVPAEIVPAEIAVAPTATAPCGEVQLGEACEASVPSQHGEASPAEEPEDREERPAETILLRPAAPPVLTVDERPDPHQREAEVAAATVAVIAAARPARANVPPSRREFAHLFAKLRRGI